MFSSMPKSRQWKFQRLISLHQKSWQQGQPLSELCPALVTSSGFHRQEMVNPYPQTPVPETGDLIDVSARGNQPAHLQQKSWHQGMALLTSAHNNQHRRSYRKRMQLAPQLELMSMDGMSVSTDTTPEKGLALGQEDVSLTLHTLGDVHQVKVDETTVTTWIPQGCWAVVPDPQQHDGVGPATLPSLQWLSGLQGEEPVRTSPQLRVCSMREAEVG
ncbi:unnamed protein product, partial [Staurois parvus]